MSSSPWAAPVAAGPVDASVVLPGSKSVTNRALVIAALAAGPSVLRRPLRSRDTLLMAGGLRAMGVSVEDDGVDWRISPAPLRGPAEVDVGNAGTVMRFLPPVATLAEGPVSFDGDPRARRRPLGPVIAALRDLGADVLSDHDRLPLVVHGRGWLLGGTVTVDASASSQFVSALLLAGPRFANGIAVRHVGVRLPSTPHISLTVAMLRSAGVLVEDAAPATWRVEPGPPQPLDTVIEPDLSNAAPFLAAAIVTGGRVHVPGWPRSTSQPGDALRTLLERMGGRCDLGPAGLTCRGTGRVTGLDADLGDVGELAPVVAALAALADSPSHLRGLAHLRGHETDRLAALARELNRLGGDVTDTGDGLHIRPRPLHGGVFATYDDHRLATAAAVLGLVVPGVEVENVATTDKTLPGFPELWLRMVVGKPA